MGDFPSPSREVVIAAEVLKDYVAGTPGSAAIEVVEIGGPVSRKYVIATSGNPDALNGPGRPPFDIGRASADLTSALRVFNVRAEFFYANKAYDFYQPLHKEAITAVKRLVPLFDGFARRINLQDVQALFQELLPLFNSTASLAGSVPPNSLVNRNQRATMHYQNVKQSVIRKARDGSPLANLTSLTGARLNILDQIQTSREMDEAQFERLMGVCIALRLNAIEDNHRTPVRNALDAFLHTMSQTGANRVKTAVDRMYQRLPDYLRALADKWDQQPIPPLGIPHIERMLNKVGSTLMRSRFCAEPRAFAFLSKDSVDSVSPAVRSQVCFWWGGAGANFRPNPPEYQVIGPQGHAADGTLSGSYMWPCTSCKNRSAEMLSGLKVTLASSPTDIV
jgi:hypothetical protein